MTIFAAIFVPAELRDATAGQAWLEAMLEAEAALARAEAKAGVIPAETADAIAASCRAELFDLAEIAERGRATGTPVGPLVTALREAVGGDAAKYVHWGATSQDILDTASMLVARRSLGLILAEVDRVAAECARHAREQRDTTMAARTLLQQAVPTTFGLKAAGWLVGVVDARMRLRRIRPAAELGGAAGTLAPLGDRGAEVAALYAKELDLAEPPLPWHVESRSRRRAGLLRSPCAAGVIAKIGLDVALLAQTEVARGRRVPEEAARPRCRRSETPSARRSRVACARLVAADASVLTGGLVQEHERALGAWHAEWDALPRALALTGAGAAAVAGLLDGLEVDAERMRANLDEAVLSERAVFELGIERDALEGRPLRDVLAERLSGDELDAALDPPATSAPRARSSTARSRYAEKSS